MKTNEKAMMNRSKPPGNWKVHPGFGMPLLLSSNKFVGASGSLDLFFPRSLSFKASNTLLPMSDLLDSFDSVYLLRTRAALSLSLAVKGDLLGSPEEPLPPVSAGVNLVAFGREAPTEYLEASWHLGCNFWGKWKNCVRTKNFGNWNPIIVAIAPRTWLVNLLQAD
ncbi:hypothetical protein G2W53_013264 [Senna tora]|uniref:Uncharacterized protein n=1 Tax=Senna tora TaxID=362788 RepID=A0A834WS52_9FABA|nr:hypothetical protein G2W53_013264 [Senna tora]